MWAMAQNSERHEQQARKAKVNVFLLSLKRELIAVPVFLTRVWASDLLSPLAMPKRGATDSACVSRGDIGALRGDIGALRGDMIGLVVSGARAVAGAAATYFAKGG